MSKNLIRYRVIIPYREPIFAMYRGFSPEPVYLAAYNIAAENKTAAVKRALDIFKHEAMHSSVSWHRIPEIKDIKTERL